MKDKLNQKRSEKLKRLTGNMRRVRFSESGDKAFLSRLENVPEDERIPERLSLLYRTYYRFLEGIYRVKNSFVEPVPVYARVIVLSMIFFSVYVFAFSPQNPRVHNIKGTVKIFDASRNLWMFARNNQKIGKGDIVKTFGDGHADISLDKVYSMRVRKDSEIKVSQLTSRFISRGIRYDVDRGKILAHYAHDRQDRKGFELVSSDVAARAVGTNFTFESLPRFGKTIIGVLDGVVKVTSLRIPEGVDKDKVSVYVKSRYKTEVRKNRLPGKPVRMLEEEWLDVRELYALGSKTQVALLISRGRGRTRELLSLAPLYISDEKPSILPEKLKEAAEIFEQAVEEGSKTRHLEVIRKFESIIKEYPNPRYDVVFRLFIGAYYNDIGSYEEAIMTFREIVDRYPGSRLTSIAKNAIGIIYEEKLGKKDKARGIYKEIVSDYPGSPEAEDALSGLRRLTN